MILITVFCASCSRKPGPAPTKVTVTGDATITVSPDAASVVISVVTQGPQATQAQQLNASKTDAVIKAINQAAGAAVEVKTNGYNLVPQHAYAEGKVPKIAGYEAQNSLLVTIKDLNKIGAVIDAATQAGANSIDRVSFTLTDRNTVSGKALAEATSQAMTKARAIAEAMGGRVTRLAEEQEVPSVGNNVNEVMMDSFIETTRTTTPIQAGPLKVSSRVQLIVEVEGKP